MFEVQDFVSKRLGQKIADTMKTGDQGGKYSTPADFQFTLLQHLLEENSFEKYKGYTLS